MSAATLGLAGLVGLVLSSCRAPEQSIPDGNSPSPGGQLGGAGAPADGAGGGLAMAGGAGAAYPPDMAASGGAAGGGDAGGQAPSDGTGGGPGGAGGRTVPPVRDGVGGQTAVGATGGAGPLAMGTGGITPPAGTGGGTALPAGQAGSAGTNPGSGGTAPPAGTGGAGEASGGTPGTPGGAAGQPGSPASGGGAMGLGGETGAAPGASGGTAAVPAGSGGTSGTGGQTGSVASGSGGATGQGGSSPPAVTSADGAGMVMTIGLGGDPVDPTVDFNLPLGTNGRACATCHSADQSMSLTAAGAQALFDATGGTGPLFRPVDGAVSPLADVSTVDARRAAYALLLSKGLIRVGLPIPANADFDLVAVKDPYGYASAAELSLFRRPLPAANLSFVSSVMWDGREGLVTPDDPLGSLQRALMSQARDATLGHAQGSKPITADQAAGIAAFELNIFSAQSTNLTAGPLTAFSALGGPLPLTQMIFYPGINDPNGTDPANPYNPAVFTMFAPWQATDQQGSDADARRQIALGEQIFNTRSFSVSGVPGLTTAAQPTVTVTCSTCHDAPGAGSNSSGRFFDLGLASASRAGTDLPLYTLQERSTGNQIVVSDPGRALITGAFKDVAMFKVPTLRGLAARAPYFHNGAAATLSGVVGFYNGRFNMGLTSDEKAALAAFLSSL